MPHPANANDNLYQPMTPVEEATYFFRSRLRAKIWQAFKDRPVDPEARWVLIVKEVDFVYSALAPILSLQSCDYVSLTQYLRDACNANEKGCMGEVEEITNQFLTVFEKRIVA